MHYDIGMSRAVIKTYFFFFLSWKDLQESSCVEAYLHSICIIIIISIVLSGKTYRHSYL